MQLTGLHMEKGGLDEMDEIYPIGGDLLTANAYVATALGSIPQWNLKGGR